MGILIEELAQESGPGPEHADHDDGRLDALASNLGMTADPIENAQPVREAVHHRVADCQLAELVQLRFVVDRLAQDREPLEEVSGPEVVEPRFLARFGDGVGGDELGHSAARL